MSKYHGVGDIEFFEGALSRLLKVLPTRYIVNENLIIVNTYRLECVEYSKVESTSFASGNRKGGSSERERRYLKQHCIRRNVASIFTVLLTIP